MIKRYHQTSNEFLENVDTISADHCSIKTNNIRMLQFTPHSQLISIKFENVYLTNIQRHSFIMALCFCLNSFFSLFSFSIKNLQRDFFRPEKTSSHLINIIIIIINPC